QSGLHLVHAIVAGPELAALPAAQSVVPDLPEFISEQWIGRGNYTSVTVGKQVLKRVQAETGCISPRSYRTSVKARPYRLSRILQYKQRVFFRDFHDFRHLSRPAGQMNRNNSASARGDGRGDPFRGQVQILPDVHKYGLRACHGDGRRRGYKRVRRGNHLVARTQT